MENSDIIYNEEKTFSTIKLLFFGFIIGVGAIMPGFSGGILAICLGVYALAINAITNLKKELKKSISLLLPLGIGAVIGVFIFGIIMKPLFESYEKRIIFLFMGFILGSIPSLIKEANKKGFSLCFLIPMVVAFVIGLIMVESVDESAIRGSLSPVILLISGGILALGVIVPGVSSSFLLIQMGIYDDIISVFVEFNIQFALWILVGAVITFVLLIKLINFAFEKFHGYAYFASLGFLISSLFVVFPGVEFDMSGIINIFLFIVGVISVYLFMQKAEK